MAHTSDGRLRRLVDEPFAVADADVSHVDGCHGCTERSQTVAAQAASAHRLLSAPRLAPDVDQGWARLQAALDASPAPEGARAVAPGRASLGGILGGGSRRFPALARPRASLGGSGRRFPALAGRSLRITVAAGVIAVVVAGGATAATVTGVFAPSHVAPVPVSSGDIQAMASLMDFAGNGFTGGFPTPNGSGNLAFGTLRWSTTGTPQQFSTLSQAEAATGIRLRLPSRVPAGVGQPSQYLAQARISATVTFNSTAGALAGHSVTIQAGPVIVAAYGGRSAGSGPSAGPAQADLPVLLVGATPRPTATTSGVTVGQVESFLLSRPGIPDSLAEAVRLLGNISDVLPVPTPAGLKSASVRIDGWPGVAVSAPSEVASGAIYEDGQATVHAAAGLLDQQEILGVAQQLG